MSRNMQKTITETVERDNAERCDIEARFWQTVDRIRERNADKVPDEELTFITDVVDEVRQEQHEADRRKTEGGR